LPFEGTSLQKLYSKISLGEFFIPSWLSIDCIILLKGMLEVNPHIRMDIEGIRQTNWFSKNYKYVAERDFSSEVLDQVVALGENRLDIEIGLRCNSHNELMTKYHLLLKK